MATDQNLQDLSAVGAPDPDASVYDRDATVFYRGAIRIHHSGEMTTLGRVCGSDMDAVAHGRRDNEEDYCNVNLNIMNEREEDTRATVEFSVHYHDRAGVYQYAKLSMLLNDRSIPAEHSMGVANVNELPDRLRAQTIDNFALHGEVAEQALADGTIHAISIQYNGTKTGNNMFNSTDYGTMNETVQSIRQHFSEPRRIDIVVNAPHVGHNVRIFNLGLLRVRGQDPIKEWMQENRRHPDKTIYNRGNLKEPDERPKANMGTDNVHKTIYHYAVRQANALKQEEEHNSPVQGIRVEAVVIPISGAGNRRFVINFPWDSEAENRPKDGDRLQGSFRENGLDEERWNGRVTQRFDLTSIDRITAIITCPGDPETGDFRAMDPEIVPSLAIEDMGDIDATRELIEGAATVSIWLFIVESQETNRQIHKALHMLTMWNQGTQRQAQKPSHVELSKFLIANDLTQFNRVNLFEVEGANPAELLAHVKETLTPQQQAAVDKMTSINFGKFFLAGPPGSGKTWLALKTGAHLVVEARQKVLLTAGQNTIVDRLCQKMIQMIRGVQQAMAAKKPPAPALKKFMRKLQPNPKDAPKDDPILVARYHAQSTETNILLRDARTARAAGRRQVIHPDDQVDLQDLAGAKAVSELHAEAYYERFPGVNDDRVILLDASPGYYMGVRSGLIPEPVGLRGFAQVGRHTEFVAMYGQYRAGNDFSPEDHELFTLSISRLREDTLAQIHVLCVTVHHAGTERVTRNFEPHLAISDENNRVSEAANLPMLVFLSATVMMFIGDPYQLKPLVTSHGKNNLSGQLSVSLLWKGIQTGADSMKLTEQNRYCPEINTLISNKFYNKSLTMGSLVDMERVAAARAIHQRLFGYESNIILAHVPTSRGTRSDANPSSYNTVEVYAALYVVSQYLAAGVTPAELGIASPYESQDNLFHRGIKLLGLHLNRDLSGILIAKFDEMTGDERPYLLVSLVRTKGWGFLTNSFRINTGLSRSKYGLVILTNVDAPRDNDATARPPKIEEIVRQLNNLKWVVPEAQCSRPGYIGNAFPADPEPRLDGRGIPGGRGGRGGRGRGGRGRGRGGQANIVARPALLVDENDPDYQLVAALTARNLEEFGHTATLPDEVPENATGPAIGADDQPGAADGAAAGTPGWGDQAPDNTTGTAGWGDEAQDNTTGTAGWGDQAQDNTTGTAGWGDQAQDNTGTDTSQVKGRSDGKGKAPAAPVKARWDARVVGRLSKFFKPSGNAATQESTQGQSSRVEASVDSNNNDNRETGNEQDSMVPDNNDDVEAGNQQGSVVSNNNDDVEAGNQQGSVVIDNNDNREAGNQQGSVVSDNNYNETNQETSGFVPEDTGYYPANFW